MPPMTALGFDEQSQVESNYIRLCEFMHFSDSRKLPPFVQFREKTGSRLIYICNKSP